VEVKTKRESRFNPASQVLVNNLASNIKLDLQQLTSSSYTHNKEPFLIDLYAQKLIYNLLHTEEANDIIVRQTLNPMDKAIQYIKENIDQPLSSKAVADYFNMSLSNFSHTFKKYVGQTPNKYINTLKMDQAKNLLATMSVTEAAFELGYETPSHFIRLFKQYYDLTPKQYQLKYLRR
jgi:AraC-like DNA-binding protein